MLRLLVHQPNVLLLDEPTNDLDTETLTILEDYIATFGGTIITVSHDRYFLNKVAQEFWYVHDGQIERIIGNFEDYEKYKEEQTKRKEASKQQPKQTKERQRKGLSYKEKREYETVMARIEESEARLEAIEQEMVDASDDYTKIQALNSEKETLEAQYEQDMTRWSELEELKEQ